MSNRRYIIYSKPFSEYVYRIMKSSTTDQRSNLSTEDLKHFSNETAMNNFVHTEPMERLLIMLIKLDKKFDLRTYDNPEDVEAIEFCTINQYQFPERRIDVIDTMVRKQVHYLSSLEISVAAHMCAQNANSRAYALSANSKDAVKRVRSLKSTKYSYEEQVTEAIEARDDLAKLLLNQLNTLEWAENTLGLTDIDLRILCALFLKRDSAMTMKQISEATKLEHKPAFLRKSLVRLLDNRALITDKNVGPRIQKKRNNKVSKTYFYMITEVGVKKMSQYRDYVHGMTFKTE